METQTLVLLTIYGLLILLASLAGGWVPMLITLTHRRMQVATSAIAGFMLGVGLLHLMPHAMMGLDPLIAGVWVLVGVLVMFFLERLFSYHHHTAPGDGDMPPVSADPVPASYVHTHQPLAPTTRLSWMGVTIGLVLHSLIAGAGLAAVMAGEAAMHSNGQGEGWFTALSGVPGIAVFIAIVLHKPFDSMTLLTLLKTTGWSRTMQHVVNGLFGLVVPLGSVLFFLGIRGIDAHDSTVIAAAIAFAAGVFLCVALADLLPEVHFHKHDRGLLSVAMLAGLLLAGVISYFESQSHAHQHGHGMHDDHSGHIDHSKHDHDAHAGHDHGSHEGHDH